MNISLNSVSNSNLRNMTTNRTLQEIAEEKKEANEKISSGSKLNSAKDDAVGVAISSEMLSQIENLIQSIGNSQDAINLTKVADSSMSTISDSVERIGELTIQASNGTLSNSDKQIIAGEVAQLLNGIDNMTENTQYNGENLLDGTFDATIQNGPNSGDNTNLSISATNVESLGLTDVADAFGLVKNGDTYEVSADFDFSNADFSSALSSVNDALEAISTGRAELGATSNALEYSVTSDYITAENLSATSSKITDADIAKEQMISASEKAKENFSMSLMAQNNQSAYAVNELLFRA